MDRVFADHGPRGLRFCAGRALARDARNPRLFDQGQGNELLTPLPTNSNGHGSIRCRDRLDGTLNYYYRDAA